MLCAASTTCFCRPCKVWLILVRPSDARCTRLHACHRWTSTSQRGNSGSCWRSLRSAKARQAFRRPSPRRGGQARVRHRRRCKACARRRLGTLPHAALRRHGLTPRLKPTPRGWWHWWRSWIPWSSLFLCSPLGRFRSIVRPQYASASPAVHGLRARPRWLPAWRAHVPCALVRRC